MNEMTEAPIRDVIVRSTLKILLPLARILIKHGISHKEFAELGKLAYVQIAESDLALDSRKQSLARISVLTGINRKEVNAVRKKLDSKQLDPGALSRSARVIGGWMSDPLFQTKAGKPAVLSIDGQEPSFATLVKQYSGDMHIRAMLDELERTGVVEVSKQNKVKLVSTGYIPANSDASKLEIMGICSADLLNTVAHNLEATEGNSHTQLQVTYNNVSAENAARFKSLSDKAAAQLMKKFNQWLSQHDGDYENESEREDRKRVGFGVYYIEEAYQDEL